MPRYSDPWSANSRPVIGLGHDRRANTGAAGFGGDRRGGADVAGRRGAADAYGQQPMSGWDTSSKAYGAGNAYGSGQQTWRDERYDAYGGAAARAPAAYQEDPYYAQSTPAPVPRPTGYYNDYEPTQPASQYGEYNLADPLARPSAYAADYAGGYERSSYGSYQAPAPRPLFDAAPTQYPRRGNAYFSEPRSQRSYGPPKMQQRPEKRRREPSRQRQPNRPPNQKQFKKKAEEVKPKNGENNGNDEDEGPEEKRIDSRFLFEKTDDAAGLFEKCNNLGDARHRQFRYKIFRVLNTLGLEFITITEQVGTYAKTGTMHMKVTLKNFFPQVFFGEADGTEHENTCYKATVQLALKLHEFGLISCETIANFYNKKLHYKTEMFERSKSKFQLLVDEVAKQQFTTEFKEGKEESAEQMEILQNCIKAVAEKVREQEKELEAQKPQAEAKPAEAEVKPADEVKVSETAESQTETAEPVPTVEEESTNGDKPAEPMEAEPAKEA